MKITKYFFIYTLTLCMAAYGITLSRICVGPDHCDSDIDWANNCHTQQSSPVDCHESAFGHQDSDCIDISISSIASSGGSFNDSQLSIAKPVILKTDASDHPFSSFDFSKLKSNLVPVFTDTTSLSIATTILII